MRSVAIQMLDGTLKCRDCRLITVSIASGGAPDRLARAQSRISVGPACRAGLRGHAATSDQSRSKGRPRGDVERKCAPWRFALRRKSFPAERTYQTQSFPAERTYINNHPQRCRLAKDAVVDCGESPVDVDVPEGLDPAEQSVLGSIASSRRASPSICRNHMQLRPVLSRCKNVSTHRLSSQRRGGRAGLSGHR